MWFMPRVLSRDGDEGCFKHAAQLPIDGPKSLIRRDPVWPCRCEFGNDDVVHRRFSSGRYFWPQAALGAESQEKISGRVSQIAYVEEQLDSHHQDQCGL
jgi:hypothetical protein